MELNIEDTYKYDDIKEYATPRRIYTDYEWKKYKFGNKYGFYRELTTDELFFRKEKSYYDKISKITICVCSNCRINENNYNIICVNDKYHCLKCVCRDCVCQFISMDIKYYSMPIIPYNSYMVDCIVCREDLNN